MKKKTKDWYAGPKTKKHIADLRYKLAITRGFISQLETALRGLPKFIRLYTQDGEVDLSTAYLEKLLKETSDP